VKRDLVAAVHALVLDGSTLTWQSAGVAHAINVDSNGTQTPIDIPFTVASRVARFCERGSVFTGIWIHRTYADIWDCAGG
jgi:hypothetical protein